MAKGQAGWIVLAIVVFLGIIAVSWFFGIKNGEVRKRHAVEAQVGMINTALQNRYEKIPQLVEVAKGYMKYEGSILEEVTKLRSQVGKGGSIDENINTMNKMESAVARLLVVVENYPDLKANEHTLTLMDEIASSQNEVKQERGRYNDMVKDYNIFIQVFPNSLLLSGIRELPYFEADAGAEIAPKIDLSLD